MTTATRRRAGNRVREPRARHVLLRHDRGQLTLLRLWPWHRLVVCCVAARLDRQLAAGLSPETSARLAIRAAQLTSMEFRRDLAASLHAILARAEQPLAAMGSISVAPRLSRLPLGRAQIKQSGSGLVELVRCLIAPGPVRVQGVAMVSQLLTDAAGPLYYASTGERLGDVVAKTLRALTA